MAERLKRSIVPSAIIRLSAIDRPTRARAAVLRAAGARQRVELFFAFDDPCSAVAVIDLAQRLAGRPVDLVPRPVVRRGIPGDPAVEDKRRYALVDARRLARRSGLELTRDAVVAPEEVAFLAEWAGTDLGFCVAACRKLWFASSGEIRLDDYAPLLGRVPVADPDAVRANERRMVRRGPYDTPAAVIGRQWWFAHDRLAQIAERLDELGWRA